MNNLTVVIVGENLDLDKPVLNTTTEQEKIVLYDKMGLPAWVAKQHSGEYALTLDYEIATYVVNLGKGVFATGYYPYYTSEGWLDTEDYGKFYFGLLMLKVDGKWYTADWVNPDESSYEIVTFHPAANFDTAFVQSLWVAMNSFDEKQFTSSVQ